MKYAEATQISGMVFSKLLGSYEKELEPILERISKKKYSEIVNIGCAEGYYSIGFALINDGAKVFAYDTNKHAISLCNRMAKLNNVEHCLITGSFCDTEILKAIPFTNKGLIISDCEGYEKYLFTEEVVPLLANHDLLIEIHDCVDSTISSVIHKRFKHTHDIEVIKSIDDYTKAQVYKYKELEKYNLEIRKTLLAENRVSIMEWYYMQPKNK